MNTIKYQTIIEHLMPACGNLEHFETVLEKLPLYDVRDYHKVLYFLTNRYKEFNIDLEKLIYCVKKLEEIRLHPTKENCVNFNDDYLLRVASSYGDKTLIQALVSQGANIQNNSVVHNIIEKCHTEILLYFLEQGLDIDYQHGSLLKLAVDHEHADMVEALLKRGASIVYYQYQGEESDYGDSSLPLDSSLDVVKILISYGANSHLYNPMSLRLALLNNNYSLLEYFLNNGVDIEKAKPFADASGKKWLESFEISQKLTNELNNKHNNKITEHKNKL